MPRRPRGLGIQSKKQKRQHFASPNLIVAIEGIEVVKRFDRKAMSRG
jgi:hypothetical protein